MNICTRIASLLAIACLAPIALARLDPGSKSHYILDEPYDATLVLEWSALPDPVFTHSWSHTATRLANGKVLVVGGGKWGFDAVLRKWTVEPSGAEIYDPANRTWSPTAPMGVQRISNLQAVRLMDGKVLVLGGETFDNLAGSAEIFDPASEGWTRTGSLVIPRVAFTATLLLDGSVLVVGGIDAFDGTIAKAEIFDPASGTWRLTEGPIESRFSHTASILPDGKVLVSGGNVDDFFGTPAGSAEIFDPVGGWSYTGIVQYPGWLHTTTLLDDGKALLVGGTAHTCPGNGWCSESTSDFTQVYDPATNAWAETGKPIAPRYRHLAVTLPGRGVLLAGGVVGIAPVPNYRIAPVDRLELFAPGANAWQEVVPINSPPTSPSNYYSATPLGDGTILFVGDVAGRRAALLRYGELSSGPAMNTGTRIASLLAIACLASIARAEEWTAVNDGLTDLDVRVIAIDPTRDGTLYAGGNGGVYKSMDGGARWRMTGLVMASEMVEMPPSFGSLDPQRFTVASLVAHLAIDPRDSRILLAGTRWTKGAAWWQPRTFKSVDGGDSWSDNVAWGVGGANNVHGIAMAPSDPSTIYIADYDDFMGDTAYPMVRSTDGGATWTALDGVFNVLAVDPLDPLTVYGGSYEYAADRNRRGVRVSRDGGVNWAETGLVDCGVTLLAVQPGDSQTLYAGTNRRGENWFDVSFNGLHKSADGGRTWLPLEEGLEALGGGTSWITSIAFDPVDPRVVFIGIASDGAFWRKAVPPSGGVYWSADAGATWSPFGLAGVRVHSLALAPGDTGNTLYAGTFSGVFKRVLERAAP